MKRALLFQSPAGAIWTPKSLTCKIVNNCEYMKIIYVNCRQRREYDSDPRSNEDYLKEQ